MNKLCKTLLDKIFTQTAFCEGFYILNLHKIDRLFVASLFYFLLVHLPLNGPEITTQGLSQAVGDLCLYRLLKLAFY